MSDGIIASVQISDVRISSKTRWIHVIVEDSLGFQGVGEASCHDDPDAVLPLLEKLGTDLLGKTADGAILSAHRGMLAEGLFAATAYSGVEQALVDIEAQRSGRSVAEFLSGERGVAERVSLYANINRRTVDRSPAGFAASAAEARSNGFRAIKIAPFDGLDPKCCDSDLGKHLIQDGIDRIAAIAEQLPSDEELMVDCHWRFTLDAALKLLPVLAENKVTWFECPLVENEAAIPSLILLRKEANRLGMRLAGLETFAAWQGFKPFVEAGAYDVVMPDVKHAGGYRAIKEICELATSRGATVSLHNPTGPVAHMASVQLMAALNTGERLEMQWDESPLFQQLTEPAPSIRDGASGVPSEPGLGAQFQPTEGLQVHRRVLDMTTAF